MKSKNESLSVGKPDMVEKMKKMVEKMVWKEGMQPWGIYRGWG
jgi:hypothetical protein